MKLNNLSFYVSKLEIKHVTCGEAKSDILAYGCLNFENFRVRTLATFSD